MNNKKLATVRMFSPEHWSALTKFSKFYRGTYNFNRSGHKAVSGVMEHFKKAVIFRNIALKLLPNLKVDEQELVSTGYTKAANAEELSAAIESIILELYSSIDCTRAVISVIYKKYNGIGDSTRKYFKNTQSGSIDTKFPKELLEAANKAIWFDELRNFRDELTHFSTGRCFIDPETMKVSYMHSGLGNNERAHIIGDIFQEIGIYIYHVTNFIESVFNFLITTLKHDRMDQICCISNGKIYMRSVSVIEAKDANGGICLSNTWFDLKENHSCPYAKECKAYEESTKSLASKGIH